MTKRRVPLTPRILSCAHCRIDFTRTGFALHLQRCPANRPPLFDRRGAPLEKF